MRNDDSVIDNDYKLMRDMQTVCTQENHIDGLMRNLNGEIKLYNEVLKSNEVWGDKSDHYPGTEWRDDVTAYNPYGKASGKLYEVHYIEQLEKTLQSIMENPAATDDLKAYCQSRLKSCEKQKENLQKRLKIPSHASPSTTPVAKIPHANKKHASSAARQLATLRQANPNLTRQVDLYAAREIIQRMKQKQSEISQPHITGPEEIECKKELHRIAHEAWQNPFLNECMQDLPYHDGFTNKQNSVKVPQKLTHPDITTVEYEDENFITKRFNEIKDKVWDDGEHKLSKDERTELNYYSIFTIPKLFDFSVQLESRLEQTIADQGMSAGLSAEVSASPPSQKHGQVQSNNANGVKERSLPSMAGAGKHPPPMHHGHAKRTAVNMSQGSADNKFSSDHNTQLEHSKRQKIR